MRLDEYAARIGGEVRGDGGVAIERIAAIDDADAATLTFAVDERYLRAALASRAAAVLTEPAFADTLADARATKPLLVVANARTALARLLQDLEPPRPPGGRHPAAVVDPTAEIAAGVWLGPCAVVGARARLGARTVIGAGAIVGADAVTGEDVLLHPRAMLLDGCVAGDRTILHAGAVVGGDGFGYVFVDGHFRRIPQVGNVVLGRDVEIGANTCVDRAQTGSTTIGDGTKIDNLVQVGHNVHIGHDSAFAAMSGIAGSTTIGDYVLVGAQCGFQGHITVGSRVRIGGGSKVWSSVPDDASISGSPAQDHRDELRRQVRLRNIEKLESRVNALERK